MTDEQDQVREDTESLKDKRARINALVEQFNAAIRAKISDYSKAKLNYFARELGITEPEEYDREALIEQIVRWEP